MKITFCDRCDQSIPDRQPVVRKNGKNICLKCVNHTTLFWRTLVVLLFVAVTLGGVWIHQNYTYQDTVTRIGTIRMMRAAHARISAVFRYLERFCLDLSNRIDEQGTQLEAYRQKAEDLRVELESTRDIIMQRLTGNQKELVQSEKALLDRVSNLESQALQLQREVDQLGSVDPDKIERALKSVVRVTIIDKRQTPLHFGSGVLIKKDGDTYYGFSAYHVIHGVMAFLEQQSDLPPEKQLNPKIYVEVFRDVARLQPTGIYEIEIVTNNKVRTLSKLDELQPTQDFFIFRFKSTDDLVVSELATDEETRALRPGDPVVGMGIHPVMRPSCYIGHIASLNSVAGGSMAVSTMAWPGMSGSPIFDRRTMKVVAILQRMAIGKLGGNTSVAFVEPLHKVEAQLREFD